MLLSRSAACAIAIFIADDDEPIASRIVYVNDAFTAMTGYTADELVGHSARLLAGARPKQENLRAVSDPPRRGRYIAIERKTRRDGTTYDAEVIVEALPQSNKKSGALHVVLTQREIG